MIKFRPIEKARTIIKNATGLDIMYAFDDLVFPDHGAFIIQFDDTNQENFYCYFHEDCIPEEKDKLLSNLIETCSLNKISLKPKGSFNFKQKEEQIEIHFI